MESKETYKGFHVVSDRMLDDETGCRAIARLSNPAFMDGVPAGLEPRRLVADRTDWSAILEYEDEGCTVAAQASSSNLRALLREALVLLGGVQSRSTRTVSWRRRALEVAGPMLRQVQDHAA